MTITVNQCSLPFKLWKRRNWFNESIRNEDGCAATNNRFSLCWPRLCPGRQSALRGPSAGRWLRRSAHVRRVARSWQEPRAGHSVSARHSPTQPRFYRNGFSIFTLHIRVKNGGTYAKVWLTSCSGDGCLCSRCFILCLCKHTIYHFPSEMQPQRCTGSLDKYNLCAI